MNFDKGTCKSNAQKKITPKMVLEFAHCPFSQETANSLWNTNTNIEYPLSPFYISSFGPLFFCRLAFFAIKKIDVNNEDKGGTEGLPNV
jgi:hypothetical protein